MKIKFVGQLPDVKKQNLRRQWLAPDGSLTDVFFGDWATISSAILFSEHRQENSGTDNRLLESAERK